MRFNSLFVTVFSALVFCGCSHNGLFVAKGKVLTVNEGGLTYVNGTVFWDMSRENTQTAAAFEDSDTVPTTGDGEATGKITIKRKIGKQVTGYLVDLSGKDPEAAEKYLEPDAAE